MTLIHTCVVRFVWLHVMCMNAFGLPFKGHSQASDYRRDILLTLASIPHFLGTGLWHRSNAVAEPSVAIPTLPPGGLASKLAKRDPSVLANRLFNVPPSAQVYPPFMRGEWEVSSAFRGYIFPSTNIPKENITSDIQIPGFQKCSIAQISDVGKESVTYKMKIDPRTGLEDRRYNMKQVINAYLGFHSVDDVLYDVSNNPNRISIDFVKYRTRNAERIELFCNARESELYSPDASSGPQNDNNIFVCSEYLRQATFSYSQDFGVARQVIGNYAHFWTWREEGEGGVTMTGNLLTAAYLDSQDPLFFKEPSKPVAIYSHDLLAKKQMV